MHTNTLIRLYISAATFAIWRCIGIFVLASFSTHEARAGTADPFFADGFEARPLLIINEVDSDTPGVDSLEFVELYDGGFGRTPLDGHVLVFFSGSLDMSYSASPFAGGIDLDGYLTDENGYFVIGNSAVAGVDLVFANNQLQNGADAVALYKGEGAAFPAGTPVTTTGLVDAFVYDNGEPDDAGLLVLLLAGQPQANEGSRGTSFSHSSRRCPNGAGGARRTSSFRQGTPSPGAPNLCGDPQLLAGLVINELDYRQSGSDLAEFVEIHNPGPADIDLSEVKLTFVDGGGGGIYSSIELSPVTLGAGRFWLTCRDTGIYALCDQAFVSALQDGPADAVALQALDETIIDTVSYDGTIESPWSEGVGTIADSEAAFTGLSRSPNGADTNMNDDDFKLRCVTPGTPNTLLKESCPAPTIPAPGVGNVLINEIMANPAAVLDATGEWFELYNPSNTAFDLDGCEVYRATLASHTITGPLVIGAGRYLVFALSDDVNVNGGLPVVNYVYEGFPLANTGDSLTLACNSTVISTRAYAAASSGVASQLSLNYQAGTWCPAVSAYGLGDLGTPGGANRVCP